MPNVLKGRATDHRAPPDALLGAMPYVRQRFQAGSGDLLAFLTKCFRRSADALRGRGRGVSTAVKTGTPVSSWTRISPSITAEFTNSPVDAPLTTSRTR